MRAVGVQLVEGRRAFGVGQVAGQRPRRVDLVQQAGRGAGGVEAAVGIGKAVVAVGAGLDAAVVEPAAEVELEVARGGQRQLFEQEQRGVVGIGARHERFLAQRREAGVPELCADHPRHIADLRVPGLEARVPAAVLEDRAGLAVLDLLVLVVGVAELALDRFEPAAGAAGQVARLAFQGEAVLLHLQPHVVLGGCAVVIAVGAVVGADKAIGPGVGAAHRAAFLLRGGAQAVAAGVAGDAQVAGLAREGVGMDRELAVAGLDQRAGIAGLVAADGAAGIHGAADAFDRLLGDAVVDHVDHAADGIAAVHQRRRAAHDLDAFGYQRIQRHRMVIGQGRGVDGAAAVLQHLDAVAIQAADHRAAGIGAEIRRRHAGQLVERLAQRAGLAHGQRVAAQRRNRRDHVVQFAAERVGGDDDFAQRAGGGGGGGGSGGLGSGRGRGGLRVRGRRQGSERCSQGGGNGRERGQAGGAIFRAVLFGHGARN
ncbi:hypothetical protein D9M69_364600 [compost metagenome]